MSHPRIEEVSDSDLSDPSEGDIEDFLETDILRQKVPATTTSPFPSSNSNNPNPNPTLLHPSSAPQAQQVQASDIKDYQMLYPVYFDLTRTRAQGRRVSKSLAVANPLAREIAAACAALRLSPVFEAHRLHPKDWANPGRVRVKLSKADSHNPNPNPYAAPVKNKHHLYVLVAQHLQAHPTTDASDALRRVRVPGLGGAPADHEPWPRPAVPRGWKMGDLLPAYSAAMTGGGVSENAFKDMMREMQSGGGGAGGGPADMMSMLGQGLGGFGGPGGGGGGGAGASGSEAGGGGGGGGGGKKGKKGKGKA
ncbi:signal recognition particle, SRP19 subunit [Daldinia decipiens]|uniref:signal recognition particle, SRP19 subunit n=1 Tax=Daldinia decipiens TaxID=326647 RepID=UPI0020C329F6|nr:signal recognition particle, SRP19 subunit [Daldinia decipiens]KAI1657392.1 signal recognition particle, SRP19 subunit [Daldinia decipiens]